MVGTPGASCTHISSWVLDDHDNAEDEDEDEDESESVLFDAVTPAGSVLRSEIREALFASRISAAEATEASAAAALASALSAAAIDLSAASDADVNVDANSDADAAPIDSYFGSCVPCVLAFSLLSPQEVGATLSNWALSDAAAEAASALSAAASALSTAAVSAAALFPPAFDAACT